ncbi:hypothetical protein KI387_029060, partial [Taxus chinensis]
VPLPQDIKALDWLQCQPQSCRLYPRCYFAPKSYEGSIVESPSTDGLDKYMDQLHTNIVRGVAGVGSAILFNNFHHSSIKDWKAIRRFLSVDSPLIRVYGSIRFSSETELSVEWLGFGSFYFVVPQIELDEFENYSVLAATIAWDHSLLRTFKESIYVLELSLQEVSCQVMETGKRLHLSVIKKYHVPNEFFWEAAIQELSKMTDSSVSKFEALLEPCKQLQQFPNVNALWAFLIIEECCRLGITYFCIAPGSRSSALAVAAAQNSHASCISCIDERSLAFHALGYARGSHKPAAVITSSGTAISNLLPA